MKKTYSLLALLLLLGSMRAFAADINTDYDHTTNFSQYKTYSWIKVQAGDSLWADRIQQDGRNVFIRLSWTPPGRREDVRDPPSAAPNETP